MKITKSENLKCKFLIDTIIEDSSESIDLWLFDNPRYIRINEYNHNPEMRKKLDVYHKFLRSSENMNTESTEKQLKMQEVRDCFISLHLSIDVWKTHYFTIVDTNIFNIIL